MRNMKLPTFGSVIKTLQNASPNSTCGFQITTFDEECMKLLTGDILLSLCRSKGLRVWIETAPETAADELEKGWRLFTRKRMAGLAEHTLLDGHRLSYKAITVPWQEILSAGHAAGYDRLHFDLPAQSIPLAYVHPEYEKLQIFLFPFSQWNQRRFAPHCKWKKLWEEFTGQSGGSPVIRTAYDKGTILPDDAEEKCRSAVYDGICREFLYEEKGILKVAEGFSGTIRADGTQYFRMRERSDCVMETAGALAVAAKLEDHAEYASKADRIFRRICNDPANTAMEINNPCRSLMNFYDNTPIYYASGNAVSALLMAVSTDDEKLVSHTLRMMFALLRLTGKEGYIRNSFNVQQSFSEHNWDHYAAEEYFHPCPHRQAAVWSLYLAAWKLTGHKPFFDNAKKGITRLMQVYPSLKWMNDYSAEPVKMLRPLSFLYRVEPDEQNRQYLDRVIRDVEKLMDCSGAVKASLHNLEDGLYPPPRSNEDYGSREASLIQTENDKCCDILYTQVFALAGLHEAAVATGDPDYCRLADKAAEFLIRTQIVSPGYPRISGLWMRAFDFEMWEYYGSSADADWGAWCVESGWVNAPAAMILSLRKAGKGLFDMLPPDGSWSHLVPTIRDEMSIVHPFSPGEITEFTVLGDEK